MTKEELIQMIEEIPDCYEINFGGEFTIKIDRKQGEAVAGFRSAKKESFVAMSGGPAPCQEMDACPFYNPA
ncbi:hypothetical protein GO013_15700 [Pseudodesulfovibrio sp. JC047]|uniref:hypothetical protein n=1 Tax=Pseudodesulfovibrio sp. JC047 TaxID=2683199 RepID=UPI0013D3D4CF|nr:hypothetical protein [Pseudodesulfovibrio sp. JC047]NDV19247.1 hypothetical protein [Pseudodesulfovibrio sp. JC047]NDV20855.1 hypothetical protein [Pseudodesulfovibrio sp. JC047]